MIVITCPEGASRLSIPESAVLKGIPTLTCPKCTKKFKPMIKQPPPPSNSEKRNYAGETDLIDNPAMSSGKSSQAPGYLVVHDENTRHQTFSLKLGRQIAGRKDSTKPCEIMIETNDKYMSRNHFVVECRVNRAGILEAILCDNNALNHTFINTRALHEVKRNDSFLLNDGDIIQAGITKIVYKSSQSVKTEKEAEDYVKSTPKGKTVLI
jgi:pSer/pThr/pTyr-binding forkhead associated (FHA) protein